MQRSDKSCELVRGLEWIGHDLDGCLLSFKPVVDGPIPGIALNGYALGDGDRDSKWQAWGKFGQPLVLFVYLRGSPVDAWEPHSHVFTEPVDRIVCAGRRDWLDR